MATNVKLEVKVGAADYVEMTDVSGDIGEVAPDGLHTLYWDPTEEAPGEDGTTVYVRLIAVNS